MQPTQANQINVEYFFRLLYDLLFGTHSALDYTSLQAWFAHLWLWIIVIGYVLALGGLFMIVYLTMRLFELRAREEEHYGTLLIAPDAQGGINPRWQRIVSLAESSNSSEWREAVIEADIMLDDMLTKQGYTGDSVGEKLKNVEPADFDTLQNAWEAHKVRNQIAHDGSTFELSQTIARRTIAQYESVFHEFKAI
jgi:hypothetical protein